MRTYRYISLGIYQNNEIFEHTTFVRKRDAQMIEELEYCNKNELALQTRLVDFFNARITEKEELGQVVISYIGVRDQVLNYLNDIDEKDIQLNKLNRKWL